MDSVYQCFCDTASRYPGADFLHIPLAAAGHYSETCIELSYGQALAAIEQLQNAYEQHKLLREQEAPPQNAPTIKTENGGGAPKSYHSTSSRASTSSPYDMTMKLNSPPRGGGADSGYMGSPQSTGSPIYAVINSQNGGRATLTGEGVNPITSVGVSVVTGGYADANSGSYSDQVLDLTSTGRKREHSPCSNDNYDNFR